MNIDTMEAGREMDVLISENVFGGECKRIGHTEYYKVGNKYVLIPFYSTDIAAAWLVVDKMCIHTIRRIINYAPDSPALWSAEIYYDDPGIGETVQLAICRVALKAVNP